MNQIHQMTFLTRTKLIFIISLAVSLSIVYHLAQGRYQEHRMHARDLANIYTESISEQINHILSASYPIAAYIQNQQGDSTGFENIAETMLPHYPGLNSLQLTRDGIIEYIVPLAGNEAALGKDIFTNPRISKETLLAKQSGNLVLTGPFELYQGGMGVIGRLPIYLYDDSKNKTFWGFASTLIKLPDILNSNTFKALVNEGYSYQLSRIHPETHQIQIIDQSTTPLNGDAVKAVMAVPGSRWYLNVTPTQGWISPNALLFQTLLAVLFSLFLTISLDSLRQQQRHSRELEQQVRQRTKTLDEHLKRLKMSFSTAKQRSFDLDLTTGIININNEYSSSEGFNTDSVSTTLKAYKAKIHPEDLVRASKAYNNCLATGTAHNIEFREQLDNQAWTWVNISGLVVEWGHDKKPTRLIGIHTDINDRKRNERVLRSLAESRPENSKDIFAIIAHQIALSYDAAYVMISSIDDVHHQAIATWSSLPSLSQYQFKPDKIIPQEPEKTYIYHKEIQTIFDEDDLIKLTDLNHFLGIKLVDNDNNVIGLISLLNTKPIPRYEGNDLALIQSLATRASNELERQKFESRHTLSTRVFAQANEGIIITDAKGNIVDVNPTFTKITGYSAGEAIGRNPKFLSSGRQSTEFYDTLWATLETTGHWQGELWNRKKNGELYAELLSLSCLKDEQNNILHYVGLFSDITESKQQKEKLELIAHYDQLTKLPNRSLFSDRFKEAIQNSDRNQKQLAICFIDLDNFKPINDNYGHDEGDQVLIKVANRIKDNIRPEDILSRHGGDEFALLIQHVESISQLDQMLSRLLEKINQPYQVNHQIHQISASIGITLYPQDDADVDTLLRHADQAMYEAKLAGKNQIQFFNAKQNQELVKIHSQRKEIQQALADNQFQLYYQPKVNMRTGEVYGAEALIRWIHPKKGLIPPLQFLPLIEGTSLEIEVGNWVIETAVKQLNQWQSEGHLSEISINISSMHLQSEQFITTLENTVKLYPELDPSTLQLEILESSELSDISKVSAIIRECKHRLGINIALDDFGTGYSALTHLRNLSANTIKIDQSFIRNMLQDQNDFVIVDAIIRLANAFNRDIIAEGVETTEHGLMLLVIGCDYGQGYCISRPLPADDFITWLTHDYQPNRTWLEYGQMHLTPEQKRDKLLELFAASGLHHLPENIENIFSREQPTIPPSRNGHPHVVSG